MKERLQQILDNFIDLGTEDDYAALLHLLEGFQKKMDRKYSQYIDSLLHLERIIDKENKTCKITVPLNPVWNNSLNIIHGGITATVLDTAMGTIANAVAPEGYGAVTNQLNIHYTAPGTGDSISCEAKIIHLGSKTVVVSGEAYRSDGRKIAHATGTFFIIQK